LEAYIMTTEAQVRANRANARKSTGPRTPEGKAIVSQNAVRHGLRALKVLVTEEERAQFAVYRDRMLGDLAPVGPAEGELAERVVALAWQLRRAERVQNEAFATLYEEYAAGARDTSLAPVGASGPSPHEPADQNALGRMLVADFSGARVLERLLDYELRIEGRLYRAMGELRRQRQLPESQPRDTHGRDAHATGTPNAIDRVWEPTHGRDAHATGVTRDLSADGLLRQTNPMGPGPGPFVRTKPISGGGVSGANKAKFPLGGMGPGAACLDPRPSGLRPFPEPPVRTKPIPGGGAGGTNKAKFPPEGMGILGLLPRFSPLRPLAGLSNEQSRLGGASIVANKANRRGAREKASAL
jgi:hypothetical protein